MTAIRELAQAICDSIPNNITGSRFDDHRLERISDKVFDLLSERENPDECDDVYDVACYLEYDLEISEEDAADMLKKA